MRPLSRGPLRLGAQSWVEPDPVVTSEEIRLVHGLGLRPGGGVRFAVSPGNRPRCLNFRHLPEVRHHGVLVRAGGRGDGPDTQPGVAERGDDFLTPLSGRSSAWSTIRTRRSSRRAAWSTGVGSSAVHLPADLDPLWMDDAHNPFWAPLDPVDFIGLTCVNVTGRGRGERWGSGGRIGHLPCGEQPHERHHEHRARGPLEQRPAEPAAAHGYPAADNQRAEAARGEQVPSAVQQQAGTEGQAPASVRRTPGCSVQLGPDHRMPTMASPAVDTAGDRTYPAMPAMPPARPRRIPERTARTSIQLMPRRLTHTAIRTTVAMTTTP